MLRKRKENEFRREHGSVCRGWLDFICALEPLIVSCTLYFLYHNLVKVNDLLYIYQYCQCKPVFPYISIILNCCFQNLPYESNELCAWLRISRLIKEADSSTCLVALLFKCEEQNREGEGRGCQERGFCAIEGQQSE